MNRRNNSDFPFETSNTHENENELDAETILSPFLLKSANIIHQNNCKRKILEFERKMMIKLEEMKKEEERFDLEMKSMLEKERQRYEMVKSKFERLKN